MSTVLHLPFNQEAPLGDMFLDYSPYKKSADRYGTVAISTAQKKYGNASAYFDGSSAYLELDSANIGTIGTGDFTIQMWVCADTSVNGRSLLDFRPADTNGTYISLGSSATNKIFFWHSAYGRITSTTSLQHLIWTHVALCRAAGITRLFINGVQEGGSYVDATNYLSGGAGRPRVGSGGYHTPESVWKGYIDDLHIDNGTALYTSDFTPAEIPYTPITLSTTLTNDAIHLSAYRVPDANFAYQIAERGDYPLYYNGKGRIVATVAIKGTPNMPVARRVRLHEQRSGNFVAETWSDNAGNYVFDYLDPAYTYYAVGFDHTGAYQGVVADQLVPEMM